MRGFSVGAENAIYHCARWYMTVINNLSVMLWITLLLFLSGCANSVTKKSIKLSSIERSVKVTGLPSLPSGLPKDGSLRDVFSDVMYRAAKAYKEGDRVVVLAGEVHNRYNKGMIALLAMAQSNGFYGLALEAPDSEEDKYYAVYSTLR